MEGNSNTTPAKPELKTGEMRGASGQVYRDSPKFTEWVRLVLDRTNRTTFGNFTQAALQVYDLDEKDPKQYASANSIGSQNFRKLNDLSSLFLQKKGVTFGMLMDVLLAKTASSQSSSWWEITMELMGYRDRKTPVQVNQNNQYNILVSDDQLNAQFEDITGETLREETLAQIFVEGDVSAGEEQIPIVEVHTEELRNEDTPNQSLPEPQSAV